MRCKALHKASLFRVGPAQTPPSRSGPVQPLGATQASALHRPPIATQTSFCTALRPAFQGRTELLTQIDVIAARMLRLARGREPHDETVETVGALRSRHETAGAQTDPKQTGPRAPAPPPSLQPTPSPPSSSALPL